MTDYVKQYEQEEKYTPQRIHPHHALSTGSCSTPPFKGKIVQAYDPQRNHFGVDVQCPRNTAVSSVPRRHHRLGKLYPNYGYVVAIQHSNNYLSIYKYNAGILKEIGDKVLGGEKIAVTGWEEGKSSSQSCTAEFQLWHMGQSIDPEKYITF